MKRLLQLLSIFLLLFIITTTVAFAHPGSLDANGGHWDRKSGTYHFHEGKNTSVGNSYNSNYSYSYSDFTPPYDPPDENPYNTKTISENTTDTPVFVSILIVVFLLWIAVTSIYDFFSTLHYRNKSVYAIIGIGCGVILITYLIQESLLTTDVLVATLFAGSILAILIYSWYVLLHIIIEKHLPKWKLSQYEQYINKFTSCIQEIKECEITIKSQSSTYTIPQEYEIGADDLPKIKRTAHWGNIFTVYTKGFNGKKIHVKFNCSGATTRHHIYYYYKSNLAEILCKRCSSKYDVPDLKWYEEYLKHQSAPKRYNFLLGKQKQLKQELLFWHQKCNSSFFNFLIFFHGKHTDKRKELNRAYSQALNFEKKPAPQSKSDPLEQASLDDFL